MELYLTYHKVLDKLQMFQQNYCCLNSFGYGNLVDFGKNVSGQTIQYPYLYVVPQSISYDQNTTTYQLSCIFADRLNESMDNEKDAVSDMSLAARQLLSEIWRGNLQDYFDAQLPVNAQPFMERFNDYVAGVALDLNIIVMEDINACEQWQVTPIPPSPTPTNTATPTVTPTNTPTNTVTPSITPTNTITPSITPTNTSTPTPTPTIPLTPFNAFIVGTGTTSNQACQNLANGNTIIIYANVDLSDCAGCAGAGYTCFPCVQSNDMWWLDAAFTIPAPDMWLANYLVQPNSNPVRNQIQNQMNVGGSFGPC